MQPAIAWKVESLRLTGFAPSFNPETSKGWWEKVGGSREYVSQENRAAAQVHEEGKLGEHILSLISSPVRIDMLLRPDPSAVHYYEPGNIGDMETRVPAFESNVQSLVSVTGFPQLNRVAIGATLIHQVSDLKAGYSLLGSLLPVSFDLADLSEFFLQANKKRRTTVGANEIGMNQLLKWAATVGTLSSLDPSNPEKPVVVSTLYAVRVEMDLSTVVEDSAVIMTLPCLEVSRALLARIRPLAESGFKGDN